MDHHLASFRRQVDRQLAERLIAGHEAFAGRRQILKGWACRSLRAGVGRLWLVLAAWLLDQPSLQPTPHQPQLVGLADQPPQQTESQHHAHGQAEVPGKGGERINPTTFSRLRHRLGVHP
jgi:hypothetical protein